MSRRSSSTLVLLGCAALAAGCFEDLSLYPADCREIAACEDPCPGECVPLPPLGFDGPALLWTGPPADLPATCPPRAPKPVYTGFAGLDDSIQCPPCSCTEPVCVLPSGVTVTDLPLCNTGPAATVTPYDAPAGWDGTCTSSGIIPADQVGSVSIAPATVRPCEPAAPEVPAIFEGLGWAQAALACAGEAIDNVCGDPGMTCLPTAEPPPPGFRQCILYLFDGEPDCPADFPEKHTFYKEKFDDTRACTACECIETQPSTCTASVAAYETTDCTGPVVGAVQAGGCVDPPVNVPIGSLEAAWDVRDPGTCAPSGGAPIGEAKPVDPRRFCCQPPP
ncbi:MAG: hypothetical protein IT372_40665 [Polyangiaceae bacterium]|nr:hypothetical protein [Polyangiaceae bacterium]